MKSPFWLSFGGDTERSSFISINSRWFLVTMNEVGIQTKHITIIIMTQVLLGGDTTFRR
jgi:hypothetical protein